MDKENESRKKRPKDDAAYYAQDCPDQPCIDVAFEYQTAEVVNVSLNCITDQTDRRITYDANKQDLRLLLKDGRQWWCKFYSDIDGATLTANAVGSIVEIVAMKARHGVWPRLFSEAKVEHLKSSIYEKDQDYITVCFYVKNVMQDSLVVEFKTKELRVCFKTTDPKFLASHDSCTQDTLFVYRKRLRDSIVPELCKSKLTTSTVDVTMRKRTAAKWDTLDEDHEHSTPKTESPVANTWTNVGRRSPVVASCSNVGDRSPAVNAFPSPDGPIVANVIPDNRKKPTCMVPPLNKDADMLNVGLTGLDNMGNTCFMNSVIQTIINTREFRDFFLNSAFQHDINVDNPLGFKGMLAISFALLCRILWSGKHRSCEPSKLKNLVASRASQFTGFAQHDAQEFMAFLLDGLHEDLNRVKDRPYIETKDWGGEPDEVFADECWRRYKLRNDSAVVDLFQGQYKSKLVCPTCHHVSITFDPFLYLSVPLPKKFRYLPIYFFAKEPSQKPIRLNIKVSAEMSVDNLKEEISKRTNVRTTNLRIFEVYKSKIQRFLRKGVNLSLITPRDLILAFEVLSPLQVGEPVVEISVIQRVTMPRRSSNCSSCDRYYPASIEPQLKRCTKCFRASYCDITCQRNHWNLHKPNCKLEPEPVGLPFILSLPQSKATFSMLCQMMESYARYSVDLFHPPVQTGDSLHHNTNAAAAAATSASRCIAEQDSEDVKPHSPIRSFDLALASADKLITVSTYDRLKPNKAETSIAGSAARDVPELSEKPHSVASDQSLINLAHHVPSVNPVIGQSRPGARIERTDPLFNIQPVNHLGASLVGVSGEQLQDLGEKPIELSATTCVSMDWRNNDRMKSYVLVQSRDLEVDENLSDADCLEDLGHFTLEQCLRLFTQPETLTPDEAWFCPKCREHREATKQMSIWRLPTILIVQLKRFSFKGYLYKDKIDKLVDYPIRGLDLSPYYCGPQVDGCDQSLPPPVYDLYAVINHYGNILGGHYTSMARLLDVGGLNKTEIEWRLFDDSHVTWEQESSAMSRSAYVLFYRRRGVITDLTLSGVRPPSSAESSYAGSSDSESNE